MVWKNEALIGAGWDARESSVMWVRVWDTMNVDVIGSAGFIRVFVVLSIAVGVLSHNPEYV